MQPVRLEGERGVFQRNAIVAGLVSWAREHGMTLSDLASLYDPEQFADDWEQLAQLTGYTVTGFCELSYVRPSSRARATAAERKLKRRQRGRRA